MLCRAYCGGCGERLRVRDDCWFAVYLEGGTRRRNEELKRLSRFPGRTELMHGATLALIDESGQISWLVENVPGLLAANSVHLVAPGGMRIRSDDPVFACLLGTQASGIRGCMTQLTRPALCAVEATLLPLRERMKTHSLADRLEAGGRAADAALLTLGVISDLASAGEKLHCPLFGRALRWAPADAADLPAALGRVRQMRAKGPQALPGPGGPTGTGKRVARLPGMNRLLVPPRPTGAALPSHGVRASNSLVMCSLKVAEKAGVARSAWMLSEGSADVIEQPPPFLFGHSVGGAAALGYRRFPDLLTVELVRSAGGEVSREVVPAADIDCVDDTVAALEVNGDEIRVAIASEAGEDPRLFIWRGAGLSAQWWRLLALSTETFLVWNARGALYLLARRGGWLLSPASGVGRYRSSVLQCPEFQGVRSLVRAGIGGAAILSAHGHLVSTVASGPPPGPGGAPLKVVKERVLPLAASALAEGGRGELVARDSNALYTLSVRDLRVRQVIPLSPGSTAVVVAGGGYVLTDGREPRFYLQQAKERGPHPGCVLERMRLVADRLGGRGGQPVDVVDRHGRLPTRANWGA